MAAVELSADASPVVWAAEFGFGVQRDAVADTCASLVLAVFPVVDGSESVASVDVVAHVAVATGAGSAADYDVEGLSDCSCC